MLTIGSLFSGIGGLELGLEWAGLGPVLWQVEKDSYRRAVLAKHWPSVERLDDVTRANGANLAVVDLVCGGFPCRGTSSAGKGAGFSHPETSLWSEFLRIVQEIGPRWVVVENPTSGGIRWVDRIVGDLERQGYAALPIPITASDVGALHRRGRAFIVAHADPRGQHPVGEHAEVAKPSAVVADTDSESLRLDEQRETEGRKEGRVCDEGDPIARQPSWSGGGFAQPDMVRMVHGLPRGLDGRRRQALGDCVVPQQAQIIGEVIRGLL